MNAEEALADLLRFLERTSHCQVLVAAGTPDDDVTVQRLAISGEVAQTFRSRVREAVERYGDDLVLRQYDPGYKCDPHELCYIRLGDRAEVTALVETVSQIHKAEAFSEDEYIIDRLKFYAIVLGSTSNRRAPFFRTYSPKKELSRSGYFALVMKQGAYDKLEDRVFLFDQDVDCFAWDGFLYIMNVANFHRIFAYFEQLQKRAAETVDAVMTRVPVSNHEEFRAACTGQLQMMQKIAQIAKKPYLKTVTMRDLKRTIEEFGLDIEVVKDRQGAEKLVFDNGRKKRWLILKLLDDDYLGSTMSRLRYEVNSKNPIG